MKKTVLSIAAVLIVGAMSLTAYAASEYKSPAEAAAGVTGTTVEAVTATRQETGITYGEIAADAGKLEEFKKEVTEIKKDILNEKVANGTLTQEKADEISKAIEENAANCDGTGSGGIGKQFGAGFGMGNGSCGNSCDGAGRNAESQERGNKGMGMGNGAGNGSGACLIQE